MPCTWCDDNRHPVHCKQRDDGWICTREPGHAGDHVACGTEAHELHRWENTMTKCVIHDCQPTKGRTSVADAQKYWCFDQSPKSSGFRCSRAKNHEGDHVACNREQHELERWRNTSMSSTEELNAQQILDALDGLISRLSDAKDYAANAQNQAEEASSSACSARESAEYAENEADSARDYAGNAYSELEEMEEELDELRDIVKALAEKEPARSLQDDVRRWTPKVTEMLKQGASQAAIAKQLDISEFLVSIIADKMTGKAA